MEKRKLWKQEIKFHLGLQILFAFFITFASYIHLPFGSLRGNLIYFAHFLLLHFSLFGFIYIFSLLWNVFKIVLPILFIIVASFAYWVYTQDLTIGVGMIQAILETNMDIAMDLFSIQFIVVVLLSAICILYFFKYTSIFRKSSFKSPLFILAIFGVFTFFIVENYKFDAFKNRLPYSVFFNTIKYFNKPRIQLIEVERDVFTKEKDLHIILVVGESVRADHLSLNGYHRNTNPLLSKQKNLISFSNVFTPFTFTAQSLPQILTDKSIDDAQETQEATSLFTVLNKAAFDTEWI